MFGKLKVFFELFQKGKEVADPAKWKSRQVTATMLVGLLLALVHVAKEFGYVIPIDESTANGIAAGIIAIVNVILTYTTSSRVGIGQEVKEPFPLLSTTSVEPTKQELQHISKDDSKEIIRRDYEKEDEQLRGS